MVHSPPQADCSASGGAGGTEIYTFTLARELGRSEEVLVFTRVAEPDLPEHTISRRTYQGIEYWAVNNTYRLGNDFELHYHNPSLDKPFKDCLKEFRPQIVHFTYVLGGLSASFIRLARESGAGVVVTLTDYNFICPWGQLLTSEGEICEGPREGLNCLPCFFKEDLSPQLGAIRRWMVNTLPASLAVRLVEHPRLLKVNRRIRFLRQMLQEADLIIAPTCSLSSRYLKWGIKKDKVINSSLGIDTQPFSSAAKIPAERVRFGFIGQPLPHKGLHILTEAFSRLEKEPLITRITRKDKPLITRITRKEPLITRIARKEPLITRITRKDKPLITRITRKDKPLITRIARNEPLITRITQSEDRRGFSAPQKDYELRIYGEPSSGEAKEYLRKALEGKNPERVRYLGNFPYQEIARIYAELDVLVIPSLWEENSPLVMLYALHTKTPVIASRVGGITELVAEGEAGRLFEVGQVEELTARLREFIQEPVGAIHKLPRQKTARGAPAVKSIEENARELKAIYNQLIKIKSA